MNEWTQARVFYDSLTDEEKDDLIQAIAESILFLDEELQGRVLELLRRVSRDMSEQVGKINRFTT